MATTAARILAETESVDTLEPMPSTTVLASSLKPGMVLLDPELMTPAAVVDHRVKAVRGLGTVAYLVLDLDARRYDTVSLRAGAPILVAARS